MGRRATPPPGGQWPMTVSDRPNDPHPMGEHRPIGRWWPWAVFTFAAIPTVAFILFVVWFFIHCAFSPTFYAPGFTEAKFASLREGMTTDEVEAIIGRPLETVRHEDGETLWTYSNRDDCTCDFEMRWLHFREGRIVRVVNTHWTE
jgi:hypothetical protein